MKALLIKAALRFFGAVLCGECLGHIPFGKSAWYCYRRQNWICDGCHH